MIDVGTRWPALHSSTEKGSSNISFIFDREWLCRYPRPRMVIYDNGTEFSSEFHELLLSYGIIPKRTTIKNHQENSFIERIHLVIANELRAMDLHLRPHDPKSNLAILQSVAQDLRSTYHLVLNSTPGQLTFGRDMVINATYIDNWYYIHNTKLTNTLQDNTSEDKSRLPHTYKPDDQVFVSSTDIKRKLSSKTRPFTILVIHNNGTITIRRSTHINERINNRRLHPVFQSGSKYNTSPTSPRLKRLN